MFYYLVLILANRAACHNGAEGGVELQLHIDVDIGHLVGGLVTLYHTTIATNEEFGEVPLNVGILIVVGIALTQHVVEQLAQIVVEVETAEWFLRLEIGVKGMLACSVYLDLIELWELNAEVGRAELLDFLNGARGLLAKLVAGEVENLQALGLVLLVQLFELFVLRGESATGGGVYNQQHLAFVLCQRYLFAGIVGNLEIIHVLC